MAVLPKEFGSLVIKSIAISSHTCSRMGRGCSNPVGEVFKDFILEQRKQPDLRGLPSAVVQYNFWKGGGLIAVSYEARKYGVKLSMRGDEAKKVCPNIQLIKVPVARGKADLSLYRHAGSEVVSVLASKGRCERASIDEVYLDLTDAAESMLSENPPEILEMIDEETLKSHILGLNEASDMFLLFFCLYIWEFLTHPPLVSAYDSSSVTP
ncbi:DNA polymerase eta-like [Tasmannia lanceolata]|uniref:DNA polymerase eta-like n=1 Tax=Tasmannia lanceolata TaxID=3420 RepID=UPI0040649F4A